MKARWLLAFALVAAFTCGLLTVVLDPPIARACGGDALSPGPVPTGGLGPIGDWNTKQVTNAAIIVVTGRNKHVPPRGWVVALAVAMQESTLRNLANSNVPESLKLPNEGVGSDHDSVGLFQQRPLPPAGAGSWGTVPELMTPAIAAAKFYDALLRIEGWENLPVTVAAQRVQGSAFPDAYARWEGPAGELVAALSGVTSIEQLPGASLTDCGVPPVVAGGWTTPLSPPIQLNSPFGPRDGVLHAGIDLEAKKNLAVRAASSGTVVFAACDRDTGNCDIDGSTTMRGCGWFVEIKHADNVATRYCHLIRKPDVTVGQAVTVGQVIGASGTSGNSSGPHLHFEIHTGVTCAAEPSGGCDLNNSNATDPVPFLRARGVALS
ncbi:M23 family metallopeptidase [Longispora sp. NPDC051575]|uniref:M23 family metallopeptidase n=1 Tax=Longispora sp. NPDC051575 TaxID=3154943 RepID=UPI003426F747